MASNVARLRLAWSRREAWDAVRRPRSGPMQRARVRDGLSSAARRRGVREARGGARGSDGCRAPRRGRRPARHRLRGSRRSGVHGARGALRPRHHAPDLPEGGSRAAATDRACGLLGERRRRHLRVQRTRPQRAVPPRLRERREDCASGIERACFILAYSHEVGYGHGDHDTPTALLWYRRGCAAGDADSCGSLAVVLRHDSEDGAPGSVPEADSAEFRALQLREERCEAGDALVCFNLARSFESGQFPAPIDPERAALLEAKACELGLDRPRCP